MRYIFMSGTEFKILMGALLELYQAKYGLVITNKLWNWPANLNFGLSGELSALFNSSVCHFARAIKNVDETLRIERSLPVEDVAPWHILVNGYDTEVVVKNGIGVEPSKRIEIIRPSVDVQRAIIFVLYLLRAAIDCHAGVYIGCFCMNSLDDYLSLREMEFIGDKFATRKTLNALLKRYAPESQSVLSGIETWKRIAGIHNDFVARHSQDIYKGIKIDLMALI